MGPHSISKSSLPQIFHKIHSPPVERMQTLPPTAVMTSAATASLPHRFTQKASPPPRQRCRAAAAGTGGEQPGRAALALPRHSDHFSGIFTAPTAIHVYPFRLQPSAPSAVHSAASSPKLAVSDSVCAGGTHQGERLKEVTTFLNFCLFNR